MNISSILIAVNPQHISATVKSLGCLGGIDVYHIDEQSGQLVVIQEADSVEQEVAGLEAIKSLPNIVYAEMVYHYLEETAGSF